MTSRINAFKRTYEYYLNQIEGIDFKSLAKVSGVRSQENGVRIPLFGEPYAVSAEGIADPDGNKPGLEVCVLLSKYVLMYPVEKPAGEDWVSYRDFKDTGPLTVYFENEAERAIAKHFAGNPSHLKKAGRALGGYATDIRATYDVSLQFDALPDIPMLVLFNDGEDKFPATCSVLFKRSAEKYLDGECLAMLGRILFTSLRERPGDIS